MDTQFSGVEGFYGPLCRAGSRSKKCGFSTQSRKTRLLTGEHLGDMRNKTFMVVRLPAAKHWVQARVVALDNCGIMPFVQVRPCQSVAGQTQAGVTRRKRRRKSRGAAGGEFWVPFCENFIVARSNSDFFFVRSKRQGANLWQRRAQIRPKMDGKPNRQQKRTVDCKVDPPIPPKLKLKLMKVDMRSRKSSITGTTPCSRTAPKRASRSRTFADFSEAATTATTTTTPTTSTTVTTATTTATGPSAQADVAMHVRKSMARDSREQQQQTVAVKR